MNKNIILEIQNILSNLPGVSNKLATKMIFAMLYNKDLFLRDLSSLLNEAYRTILQCSICGNIDNIDPCQICTDLSRDRTKICIVESIQDMYAIEKTKYFNGLYHILMGRLSVFDNLTPDKLNILPLTNRLSDKSLSEIIIALSSTVNGQTTTFYLTDVLKDKITELNASIAITSLAKGIPIGSGIDYLDEGTLIESLRNRHNV